MLAHLFSVGIIPTQNDPKLLQWLLLWFEKILICLIESVYSLVYFRPFSVTTSFVKLCSFVSMSPPPYDATVPSGPGPPHCGGFTITETPHSVGLLCTSDQPVAGTST
jgi:hypothetical protein